ncbi:FecCD family ABC transporter permease [Mycetocola tolaasinivorans]|uniref:FecCD family ABC transporter permease n=1 Tax=Mycetocola tolaasinivorans TaxID=76635 RepID=UPI001FE452F0|nr:iron chelate uptake ABC transporter family permease subunit [Mycetocola tolaasinivorans]
MSAPGALSVPVRAVRRRARIATILLGVAVAALALYLLSTGELPFTPGQVLAALAGQDAGGAGLIVREWRAPRVLLAILIGAALALSGALFQIITRNPLGSPDIIGFTTGAYTGALLVMLGGGSALLSVSAASVVGGLLTAAVIWLLVMRRGASGFRLIVVGIAITAMLNSFNIWIVTTVDQKEALSAAIWGAGSLNGVGWEQVPVLLITLMGAVPALALLAGPLRVLELGDDLAAALGTAPERVRLAAIVLGVVLVAVATAITGPIAFVALAAPQIARRLCASPGIPYVATALTGALILLASDLIATRALAPTQLPTGVVTICVGGAYLAWLLGVEGRRRR